MRYIYIIYIIYIYIYQASQKNPETISETSLHQATVTGHLIGSTFAGKDPWRRGSIASPSLVLFAWQHHFPGFGSP